MEARRIKILPEDVINRIAAGEVVERPASVVKELIENSIDAGAQRIVVDIADGGSGLIRVVDDGEGMGREDAVLAFSRHATSKLFSEEDLFELQSLGFRGEALPSIASVSKIRMVTLKKGFSLGCDIKIEAGNVKDISEVGAPEGTLIEVEDLFYNTPARRKFLKTATTEMRHISQLILQRALAYPSLHFQLNLLGKRNRRPLYNFTPVKDAGERILQAYGEPLFSNLIQVNCEEGSMKLRGFISRPLFTRSERNQQELFVNDRPVRNPTIRHAVYQAYDTLLTRKRHPMTFLYMELPPHSVDVNVHPSKQEVRFRDAKGIHDWVKDSLRAVLVQGRGSSSLYQLKERDNGPLTGNEAGKGAVAEGSSFDSSVFKNRIQNATEQYLEREGVAKKRPLYSQSQGLPLSLSSDLARIPDQHPRLLTEKWFPVAHIHDTFILAMSEKDLYFVDQHTAHERVLFERLLGSTRSLGQDVQQLLIPFPLELSLPDYLLLKEHQQGLEALGIELEDFGERSMVVRAIPALIRKEDCEPFLLDLMDDLIANESFQSSDKRRKKVIATIACHSAVRAHRPMKKEEMSQLLFDLQNTELPFTCPHGRPTVVKLDGKTLDHLFWR